MDKRVLLGCIAALSVLLLGGLAAQLAGANSDGGQIFHTPLGRVPLGDVLMVLLAMTVGGAIARRKFRAVAVLMVLIVWLAILTVLVAMIAPDSPPPMASLPAMLKYNGVAIVLNLLAAWAGASLGQFLAARRSRGGDAASA
ncbi:hypothetical protein LVB77_02810 [Lysobacter sp. 5GHs7-4]|uniref:hypothetical protein n=1 Tax=Lysobacter sp. 5GHs7-4 TaxID=2904253 RepID=UPI001E5E9EA6|nr:hypothetical protein [Lysobacter sp. 5GHs7-4]UHQ23668.1 hypothetical protein LVB77_02810 [Lysobacter sp. 5GHs7-4]